MASCRHGPVKKDFLYSVKRWLSISHCCFWEEATVCNNGKAFFTSAYLAINKTSGHNLWVKPHIISLFTHVSSLVVAEEPDQIGHKEGAIVMAGPMPNWDPIFVVNLILGLITTTLAAVGTFTDLWFTYTVTTKGLVNFSFFP